MLLNKRVWTVFGKKENQDGITIVEISVGLAIIAFLAIFLAPRVGALFGKTRVELAQQEITPLVIAAQQYRQANGDYAGISIPILADGGYHIDPFSSVNSNNVYGVDIGLGPSDSNNSATLLYTADEHGSCLQLLSRIGSLKPVTATCSSDLDAPVLTAIIK